MKIKQLLLCFLFTFTMAFPIETYAFFVDGVELSGSMLEFEKASSSTPGVDWEKVYAYTKYVDGVYDNLSLSKQVCTPREISKG